MSINGHISILLRHGDDNAKGPEYEESRLTEEGICQIERVAKSLRETKISAVFASPLLRTIETAKIICETLGTKKPLSLTGDFAIATKTPP